MKLSFHKFFQLLRPIRMGNQAQRLLSSSIFAFLVLSWFPQVARAQWFGGAGMGFGAAGLSKQVLIEDELQQVNRAEGPGVLHAFADRLYKSSASIGLEHLRGFRLGPFTSGVSFTSLVWRWYYLGIATDFSHSPQSSRVFIKRWTPYLGLATGLAFGDAVREASEAPKISASGVHIGIKNGIDYLVRPTLGFRYEVSYLFTFSQTGQRPASLTSFSLWAGFLIPFGDQKRTYSGD